MPRTRSPPIPARRKPRPHWLLAWVFAAMLPGAALALPPAAAGLLTQSVQWRMGLTDTTQFVLERRPWRVAHPSTDPAADPAAAPAQVSLGLEFRSVDLAKDARGLLLVQLPGSSVLQFRPRSGGLTLNYRLQF